MRALSVAVGLLLTAVVAAQTQWNFLPSSVENGFVYRWGYVYPGCPRAVLICNRGFYVQGTSSGITEAHIHYQPRCATNRQMIHFWPWSAAWNQWYRCQSSPQQSGSYLTDTFPRCVAIDCATPAPIASGSVTVRSNVFPGEAWYTCNAGCVLSTSDSSRPYHESIGGPRRCGINRAWQGAAPRCLCFDTKPANPENGNLIVSPTWWSWVTGYWTGSGSPFFFPATIQLQCDTGFVASPAGRVTVSNADHFRRINFRCNRPCGAIRLSIGNGTVQTQGQMGLIATTVTYSCNAGYRLPGRSTLQVSAQVSCGPSGWSGLPPNACEGVPCDALPTIADGTRKATSAFFPSTATFSCAPGFSLIGQSTFTCGTNGQWAPKAFPSCKRTCIAPTIKDGSIVSTAGLVAPCAATYACNAGFQLMGTATAASGDAVTWRGVPTCAATCRDFSGTFVAGTVSRSAAAITAGQSITFTCNTGYILDTIRTGSIQLNCLNNNTYDAAMPTKCIAPCSTLSAIANGNLVGGTTGLIGDVGTYTCNDGYTITGLPEVTRSEAMKCNADGWTDEVPSCQLVTCSALPQIANGITSQPSRLFPGTTTYTCNAGYTLVGEASRSCGADAVYTGIEPVCAPNVVIPTIASGAATASSTFVPSILTVTCNAGYKLSGNANVNASLDGGFIGLPTCVPACDAFPTNLLNTTVVINMNSAINSVDNSGLIGNSITYTCDNGFTFDGSATGAKTATVTCTESGLSDSIPTCLAVTCAAAVSPANGLASRTTSSYPCPVVYSCESGYSLFGDSIVSADFNGVYPNPPQCIRNCYPPTILSGSAVVSNATLPCTATLSCESGFVLNSGVTTLPANADGSWPLLPQCVQPCQPFNTTLVYGDVVVPRGALATVLPGDQATYTCNPGYVFAGVTPSQTSQTLICTAGGSLSGNVPSACEAPCPAYPATMTNGRVSVLGRSGLAGSSAYFICDNGYEFQGRRQTVVSCSVDGISGSYPSACVGIPCESVSTVPNGAVSVGNNGTFPSTATYSCNKGYVMRGPSSSSCRTDGKWSTATPSCVAPCTPFPINVPKGDITITSVAGDNLNLGLNGDSATITCNPGWTLDGAATGPTTGQISCTPTGWSPATVPTCRAITCATLSAPANGYVNQPSRVFPNYAVYGCDNGFVLYGDASQNCLPNGQYNGTLPRCVPTCKIPDVPNGFATVSSSVADPTCTATITCSGGYKLSTDSNLATSNTLGFFQSVPSCLVPCTPFPTDLPKGVVTLHGSNLGLFGESATFSCAFGYVLEQTLEDSVTVTCRNPGFHNPSIPDKCIAPCPSFPMNLPNGQVRIRGVDNLLGSQAIYTCDRGYLLDTIAASTVTVSCGRQGLDVNPPARCIGIKMATLNPPINGLLSVSNDGFFPSVATFSCNLGYVLRGKNQLVSNDDGSWDGLAPICALPCSPFPTSTANGDITLDNSLNIGLLGSSATVTCTAGYTFDGNPGTNATATVSCTASGWSRPMPTCQAIACQALDKPTNGGVAQNTYLFPNDALYSCDSGYVLTGSPSRTCGVDGLYTPEAPTCIRQCSVPTVVNGYVTVDSPRVPCTATTECQSGFVMKGNSQVDINADGSWSNLPQCIAPCGAFPSSLANSAATLPTNNIGTVGQSATYTCNPGYVVFGSFGATKTTGTCNVDGVSPSIPPQGCVAPCENFKTDIGLFGSVAITGTDTLAGSRATYTCNAGYLVPGTSTNVATVQCTTTGLSGAAPSGCVGILCGAVSAPTNGQLAVTNNGIYPSSAYFSCNQGYELVGTAALACSTTGNWGEAPTCRGIKCAAVPSVANGQGTATSDRFPASVSYTCNTGYIMDGSAQADCLTTGGWSVSAPTCKAPCPAFPSTIENGRITVTGAQGLLGTSAVVQCDTGYTFSGLPGDTATATVTCGASGFSGEIPQCRAVQCTIPSTPADGKIIQDDLPVFPNKISFSCLDRFTMVGASSASCQPSGTYDPVPPTCIPNCYEPKIPNAGSIVLSSKTVPCGFNVTCAQGYVLEGPASVDADSAGNWPSFDKMPSCVASCGAFPTSLSNGQVAVSGSAQGTVGSSATFTCNKGYAIAGVFPSITTMTVTCQSLNFFDNPIPTGCVEACPDFPSVPANAAATYSGQSKLLGSYATYTCNPGYKFASTGATIATSSCSANGLVGTVGSECVGINCLSIYSPVNGSMSPSQVNFDYPATVKFACDAGFQLVGSSSVSCTTTGEWTAPTPTCRGVQGPSLDQPANGQLFVKNAGRFPAAATVQCQDGYAATGAPTLTLKTDGTWSGTVPTCDGIQCGDLLAPVNGKVTVSNNNQYPSRATFTCNTGYVMSGSGTANCATTGAWSSATPTCTAPCQSWPTGRYLNSLVTLTGTNGLAGAVAVIKCDSGYTLDGMVGGPTELKVECTETGSNPSTFPTCQAITCNDLSAPTNGKVSQPNRIFPSTATYSCDAGYVLVGSASRTCQGDGTYAGDAPTCVAQAASITLANTIFTVAGTLHPATLTITGCATGFVRPAVTSFTTLSDGSWPLTVLPCTEACKAWPTTSTITDGTITKTGSGSLVGDTMTWTCNAGFVLTGVSSPASSRRITCTASGWDGVHPTGCARPCPAFPAAPANGAVAINGSSGLLGSTAVYSCNPGYRFFGTSATRLSSVCGVRGLSRRAVSTCTPIRCPAVPKIKNGGCTRTGARNGFFPSDLTCTCQQGYRLVGSATASCTAQATWSTAAPSCVPVTCPALPTQVAYGSVTTSAGGPVFRAVATFSCNNGYARKPVKGWLPAYTIVCRANGQWSGPFPECRPVACATGPIFTPASKLVAQFPNLLAGTQASISCADGWVIRGANKMTCTAFGEWAVWLAPRDQATPRCVPSVCNPNLLPKITNAQDWNYYTDKSLRVNDRATLKCKSGFVIDGPAEASCANGRWNPISVRCIRPTCGPLIVNNGVVKVTGLSATVECNFGFRRTGSNMGRCVNRVWRDVPYCAPVMCSSKVPTVVTRGSRQVQSYSFPGIVSYRCPAGLIPDGSDTWACTADGSWRPMQGSGRWPRKCVAPTLVQLKGKLAPKSKQDTSLAPQDK